MADLATTAGAPPASLLDGKLTNKSPAWISGLIVLIALAGGLAYVGFRIAGDLGNVSL